MKITTSGTQKESKVLNITPAKNHILHYDLEYDSTNPEQTLRDFVANAKAMVARFETNKNRIIEIESELQDLYHYIEISTYKKVPDGYKLYRKMAELRRERRACKNENDLLQPIYEHFHATEVLNKLTNVQGECAKCKEAIDNRFYAARTDILDEWLEPPETTVDVVSESEECDNLPVDHPADDKEGISIDKKPASAFKLVWKAN